MAIDCSKFSSFLFRRTPNFIKEVVQDMIPRDVVWTSLYENKEWTSFTGTTHTWDRVHVAHANDSGDWETIDAGACAMNICDPSARQIDWGSTRSTFTKLRRAYKTRILCLDQLRNVEEAQEQLDAIWKGLARVPEDVNSNFLRYMAALGSNQIYICGSAGATVTTTASIFTGGLSRLTLGSTGVPTSKLTMQYLQKQVPSLQYNGYFNGDFTPSGKFQCITDMQTVMELCNANPALAGMYEAADFEKGGKYFQYGAMMGCGNFLFKIDPFPARFYPVTGSSGTFRRVFPFENTPATVGLKPTLDPLYEAAPYQLSIIPHRNAREIHVPTIPSIHPQMKFGSRDLYGKWAWINGDMLTAGDPNTGATCTMDNPRRNKGYFLSDFEAGVKNTRPELECVILHLREPQAVADVPVAVAQGSWSSTGTYQDLLPYFSSFCDTNSEE